MPIAMFNVGWRSDKGIGSCLRLLFLTFCSLPLGRTAAKALAREPRERRSE